MDDAGLVSILIRDEVMILWFAFTSSHALGWGEPVPVFKLFNEAFFYTPKDGRDEGAHPMFCILCSLAETSCPDRKDNHLDI